MNNKAIVEIRNLQKKYGQTQVLPPILIAKVPFSGFERN
jgi:hypothetical protein